MKDLATTLFKVSTDKSLPCCGGLLIAQPFLQESYFCHSVVSIIDYLATEGATGVVMNNRTGYTLDKLLDGIRPGSEVPVYCGGPLGQNRLYFIHNLGAGIVPHARLYSPGLYVGGDFEAIISYINAGYPAEGSVRFFIGYSSWSEGMLEREINEGSWVQAPLPQSYDTLLTLSGDAYWHRAVRSLGDTYRSWRLLPQDPEYN